MRTHILILTAYLVLVSFAKTESPSHELTVRYGVQLEVRMMTLILERAANAILADVAAASRSSATVSVVNAGPGTADIRACTVIREQ